MLADPPLHPSYEDRAGRAGPGLRARSTTTTPSTRSPPGRGRCSRPARADADVLHLHHLTPLNEAAARVAPGRAGRRPPARHRAADARGDRGASPDRWPHGAGLGRADARLGGALPSALIVLSETPGRPRRARCSGIDPDALRRWSPTASTPSCFTPRHVDRGALAPHLVDEPRAGRRTASRSRYGDATSRRSRRAPVLLYVGRFTEVKRIPLLIEAYARARPGFRRRAPLVLVGGFPGEWEGEHPLRRDRAHRRAATSSSPAGTTTTSCRTSSPPPTSSCCRRCASSSARCWSRGWPAGCRRSPSTPTARRRSSTHGETGWLVEPDDVARARQRAGRGRQPPGRSAAAAARNAAADGAERYAWPALAAATSPRSTTTRADATSLREDAALSG